MFSTLLQLDILYTSAVKRYYAKLIIHRSRYPVYCTCVPEFVEAKNLPPNLSLVHFVL